MKREKDLVDAWIDLNQLNYYITEMQKNETMKYRKISFDSRPDLNIVTKKFKNIHEIYKTNISNQYHMMFL